MPSEVFVGFLQDQVQILKEKVAKLEAELERNGFRKSADDKLWIPPVNEEAAKLWKEKLALEAENERLREDDAMITGQIGQLEEERDALKEQVARLTAPVSDEEVHNYASYGANGYFFTDADADRLIAARARQKGGADDER